MRRRSVGVISALVLAMTGLATGTGAASASSAAEVTPQNPWHRYHQEDFVVPRGEACAFKVAVHVLYDREFYRTISRYADGTPRVQLFRGPLIIQYINVPKGTKVIRDLSGTATVKYTRSGEFLSIKIISGHFGAVLSPGSVPGPGVYYVGGQGSSLVSHPDGTETLKLGPDGRAQNLCPILR